MSVKTVSAVVRLFVLIIATAAVNAQTLVKVTDTNNPIVSGSAVPNGSYRGASWIDFDGDHDDDLYVSGNSLYRNDRNGQFTRLTTAIIAQPGSLGNSWADLDNDGDMDCFVAGFNSVLFRNDGGGIFNRVLTGGTADTAGNRGWACTWGDYDEDGFADVAIAHPRGFVGTATTNHFLRNAGDGTMTKLRLDSIGLDTTKAPYTVGSWSDFDQDGDMDLFFGTGPAGSLGPDYLYRNRLKETGSATFERILEGDIVEDRDGQIINWIDYDNDGDLDAFITNYSLENQLYRNDNGTIVKMLAQDVGSIVAEPGAYLSSTWADFDNDGDLDCYVTQDGGASRFYENNGNGTFTRNDTTGASSNGARYTACAADYDLDGRMDLYVSGSTFTKALYHNETANAGHWMHVQSIGDPARHSNRAAIGARVRVKAMIGGIPTWQLREVSSQNSFNGHNSLTVHFGLGDAIVVDSLIVIWPSDSVEVYTGLEADHFYTMTEGQDYTVLSVKSDENASPQRFELHQNFPNPFNPSTTIRFSLDGGARVQLKVYNMLGQEVRTLVNRTMSAGEHTVTWDGRDHNGNAVASGIYLYRLTNGSSTSARKMLFIK